MNSMDFEKARYNMVEQQIRPWDVLDPRVLEVLGSVPRENFTPEHYRNLAYVDTRIPLNDSEGGCCMLNPNIEGRILQHLNICKDDVVLEIGTGTGYLTACLAKLARHVDSVEIDEDLCSQAEKNLAKLGIDNATIIEGDATRDLSQKQFYDAIAITGSMSAIPEVYKKMLKVGGRLFVVTGQAPVMTAHLVTRTGDKEWTIKDVFETSIDSLCGAEKAKTFEF